MQKHKGELCLPCGRLLLLYSPMKGMMKVQMWVQHRNGRDWFSSSKQRLKGQHHLDQLRSVRGQSDFRLPLPKHSHSQSWNQHGDGQTGDQESWDIKCEWKGKARAAESNHRVDYHPRKAIPYKEYVAHQEKASTASKLTLEDKENWDEEPLLPPPGNTARGKIHTTISGGWVETNGQSGSPLWIGCWRF